jgi:formylglycine-generating enzyme required for sulfatase activity
MDNRRLLFPRSGGGSWDFNPQDLRSANRDGSQPDYRYNDVGFRVARTLSPPAP